MMGGEDASVGDVAFLYGTWMDRFSRRIFRVHEDPPADTPPPDRSLSCTPVSVPEAKPVLLLLR